MSTLLCSIIEKTVINYLIYNYIQFSLLEHSQSSYFLYSSFLRWPSTLTLQPKNHIENKFSRGISIWSFHLLNCRGNFEFKLKCSSFKVRNVFKSWSIYPASGKIMLRNKNESLLIVGSNNCILWLRLWFVHQKDGRTASIWQSKKNHCWVRAIR